MMLAADALATIDAALAEELAEVRRLTGVLEQERVRLAAGLDEDIAQLAQQKLALGDRLAALAGRREALLTSVGVSGGIRELQNELPARSAAEDTFRQLRSAAREAKALNDANGALIDVHRVRVHARLATLAPMLPSATYDRGGATARASARRSLDAA